MRQSADLTRQLVDLPRDGHLAPPREHLLLEDVGGAHVEPRHPDHPEESLVAHEIDAAAGDAAASEPCTHSVEVAENEDLR